MQNDTVTDAKRLQLLLEKAELTYQQYRTDHATIQSLYDDLFELLEVFEEIRLEHPNQRFNLQFLARYDLYETMVAVAYSLGYERDAFEYAERGRARGLLDRTLNKIPIHAKRLRDQDLLQREITLKHQVQNLTYQWQKETLAVGAARDIAVEFENEKSAYPAENIEPALRKARQELLNIQNDIRDQDPAYVALRGIMPGSSDDIAAIIDNLTAVLVYSVTEERIIIFVIASDAFWSEHTDIPHSEISDLIVNYRRLIQENTAKPRDIEVDRSHDSWNKTDVQPSTEALKSLARRLYKLLISPVEMHLAGKKRLCIVPDSDLYLLPFEALCNETTYLIEHYAVWYAPSVSLLDLCYRRQQTHKGHMLALGNPELGDPSLALPYSEQEVLAIAPLFDAKPYTRLDANLTTLKENWEDCDLLHLACHAQWDHQQPEFSALLLTPTDSENGRLEVHELFELDQDLAVNLVTLSACNTSFTSGEALSGLATGFLYAGSPAVVASLWPVDDLSTSELMVAFYAGLSSLSRLEALHSAQISLLNSNMYSSPYFWAAFRLIGNPLPIQVELKSTVSAFNFVHQWTYKASDGYLLNPTASNGMLFVTWRKEEEKTISADEAHSTEVWAIAITDRQLVWKHRFSHWADCFSFVPTIVHINTGGTFYALNTVDGEMIWERPTSTFFRNTIIHMNELLYIGGYSQLVCALDPKTGQAKWEYELPRPGSGGFEVKGDIVRVGCKDHHIYELNSHDGTLVRSDDLGWEEWSGSKKDNQQEEFIIDQLKFICWWDKVLFQMNLSVQNANDATLLRRIKITKGLITSVCRDGNLIIFGDGHGILHGYSIDKIQSAIGPEPSLHH